MLWVGGPVEDRTCGSVCELCNTSFGEAIDAERDGSNGNCFVTSWRLTGEAPTSSKGLDRSHLSVSGLKTFSPRSESRRSSSSVSHELEENPPVRKAGYVRIVRLVGKWIFTLPTEFTGRFPMKFSLMQSTVDRMEGSKNPDTSFLYGGHKW